MGPARLLLAGPARHLDDERLGVGGHRPEELLDRLDRGEVVHPLGAGPELGRRLGPAQEEQGDERLLGLAELPLRVEVVLPLVGAAPGHLPGEDELAEAVEASGDLGGGQVGHRLAGGPLVAGGDEALERHRVDVGGEELLLEERPGDADLHGVERAGEPHGSGLSRRDRGDEEAGVALRDLLGVGEERHVGEAGARERLAPRGGRQEAVRRAGDRVELHLREALEEVEDELDVDRLGVPERADALGDDEPAARRQRGARLGEDGGEVGGDVEAVDRVDGVERAGRGPLRLPRLRHVELRRVDRDARRGGGAGGPLAPAEERRDDLGEEVARDARPEPREGGLGRAPGPAADLEDPSARLREEAREGDGAEVVVDRVEEVAVREVAEPEREPVGAEEDLLARLLAREEEADLLDEDPDRLARDRGVGLGRGELGLEGLEVSRLGAGRGVRPVRGDEVPRRGELPVDERDEREAPRRPAARGDEAGRVGPRGDRPGPGPAQDLGGRRRRRARRRSR